MKWRMTNDFRNLGEMFSTAGAGEIGMHPHAWNMPPGYDLTGGDHVHQPYLFDYPGETRCQKIEIMPRCLERIFETKMVSHRAGPWGFDNYYARILAEFDYKVDCSITPHMSWRLHTGDPTGPGGPDFRYYPSEAYFLDLDDVRQPGCSRLLELPVTIDAPPAIQWLTRSCPQLSQIPIVERSINRILFRRWLRPTGKNIRAIAHLVNEAVSNKTSYLNSCFIHRNSCPAAPRRSRMRRVSNRCMRIWRRCSPWSVTE